MKRLDRNGQAGLSLVEMMIAMLIGTLLLLGLFQVFGASRESYRVSEGLARVQENSRFALHYLQRDIRMAGHFGCVNDQARGRMPQGLNSHFASPALDFGVSIRGYDGAPPAGEVPVLNPAPLAGRDAIVLRFLSGTGIPVTSLSADTIGFDAAKWELLTREGVAEPRMFGIADCVSADVFAATDAGPAGVTVPGSVSLARYGGGDSGQAMLYRAEALVYYIANGAGGRPSLWRARINADGSSATSEELVEGVEDLQLRFGQDALGPGGLPTGYVSTQGTAASIGAAASEWGRVGQVQVGLLLASPDRAVNNLPAAGLSLFGEGLVVPDDGRYRATYQSTVALRNRLYGN